MDINVSASGRTIELEDQYKTVKISDIVRLSLHDISSMRALSVSPTAHLTGYAYLRRQTLNPKTPDTNNQAAAGTGTGLYS